MELLNFSAIKVVLANIFALNVKNHSQASQPAVDAVVPKQDGSELQRAVLKNG